MRPNTDLLRRLQSRRLRFVAVSVVVLGGLLAPVVMHDPYYYHLWITAAYYIILALSLRLIMIAGEVSFAHAAFAAIGAYSSALLVKEVGLSSWAALPLAAIICGLIGVIIGFPSLRLKGAYFFLATFAFGQVVVVVLGGYWTKTLGGKTGLLGIPGPSAIGSWEIVSKTGYYGLIAVLAVLTALFMWRVDKSRLGLILRSIASNDKLAQSIGIGLMRYKVMAFAITCAFAGIAGSFYAHYIHIVSPESFSFMKSIEIVAYVVVGGTASIAGPIVGVVALMALAEFVQNVFGPYEYVVYGMALMTVFLFMPEGLLSLPARIVRLVRVLRNPPEQWGMMITSRLARLRRT